MATHRLSSGPVAYQGSVHGTGLKERDDGGHEGGGELSIRQILVVAEAARQHVGLCLFDEGFEISEQQS